ncbi:hypothetical protein BHE90_010014 [Fusarium euwallaceae]|uniref:Uncharacterized protein n=1 Tax=Fusarium euwallaceae TaxID=1147111 RepID=A0A430LIL4_9HYPO|nr:hypothetical protein BHE90_010014 [Fusarium euwallaceae]
MAGGRKYIPMSFDWYESTTGDYIEPVEEEEKSVVKVEKIVAEKAKKNPTKNAGKKAEKKAEEKVDEEVTIYITGQSTNKRFRNSWAITLYDDATKDIRSYEVRKALQHTPCTLKSSKGHPGDIGVQYITMGKVSCDRGQELMDLLEMIPVTQSKSAAYANRQYINDVARFLVAGDFVTKRQRGRAMATFANLIKAERQQVEDEHKKVEDERQKAEAAREKARAQAKNDRQSQKKVNKVNKGHSQGNGAFPSWFLDGGN